MPPAPAEPADHYERPKEPEPRAGSREPLQPAYNRDDEMKPGSPPRSAHEPEGSEGSSSTPKTATDPATGEWRGGPPAPAQSDADETDDLKGQ
ncbi:hypothetical protein [Phenylobacterium sp.]|uniref:hypothetical protein n=1 Tax=Phenylobacterium sp. TaxID=1871053 RepID=UPI002E31D89D|nr:hypothetical protein [Phenylobacterium sp.]HEX2562088.1 hypothetical protein [Phenylobacterium sp.]